MSKKQLYTLEFPVRCSPAILWDFLSTPAGLQEWFADRVDEWDGTFSFTWSGGTPEKALVLDKVEEQYIRFRWTYMEKNEYFEFKIEKTEISNQTVLVVKDFAEKGEIKDASQLWQYQIKDLFHRLGA
ncbi:MAG: START-like domain-containing protein [Chitinophagaceae bacterium]